MQLWQELLKARRTVSTAWTPPAGQIGWWYSLADVAPLGTWADQSGNSHTATLVGNAAVTAGTGLVLDGTGDYGKVATDASIQILGPMAACFWLRVTGGDYTRSQQILGNWSGAGASYLLTFAASVDEHIEANWQAGFVSTEQTTIADALWRHVGFVRTGSAGNWTVTWYIGGVQTNQTTGIAVNPVTSANPLEFGNLFGVSGWNLAGTLDDIQIYNVALSQPQIADIYANSPGSHAP